MSALEELQAAWSAWATSASAHEAARREHDVRAHATAQAALPALFVQWPRLRSVAWVHESEPRVYSPCAQTRAAVAALLPQPPADGCVVLWPQGMQIAGAVEDLLGNAPPSGPRPALSPAAARTRLEAHAQQRARARQVEALADTAAAAEHAWLQHTRACGHALMSARCAAGHTVRCDLTGAAVEPEMPLHPEGVLGWAELRALDVPVHQLRTVAFSGDPLKAEVLAVEPWDDIPF